MRGRSVATVAVAGVAFCEDFVTVAVVVFGVLLWLLSQRWCGGVGFGSASMDLVQSRLVVFRRKGGC